MIRLIAFLVLIVLAATGFSWIADRPGSLTIDWLGYDIRTSVFIATIVLVVTFAALALTGWLGILTVLAPKRFARKIRERRRRVGQEAVRRGIFAAGAGDKIAALKAGAIAKKNVPEEPLALLLEAQSAQLNEDPIASRQAFERMLDKPEMAELGLRGLFIEAKKAGQTEAAKQFAERALTANPALSWSSSAVFEMQCREGDWRAALKTLQIAKQNRHLGKGEADRRRALLLTQLAIELEDSQQTRALAYATEAFELAPSLIPAAAVAGRILTSQGQTSRATKILTQAWRTTQHPEIALIFAHARRGDSPRDRLSRVKSLVAAGPVSLEGAVAIAVAAIEAKDWKAARLALEPHLANTPPARVCRLMARIEAGQNRDAGRAREWLAKAARGAPDPIWMAPDGSVSAEWQPMSPATGALGVLEWKAPPAVESHGADDFIAEMSALDIVSFDSEPVPDMTKSKVIPAPKGNAKAVEDVAGGVSAEAAIKDANAPA
jgi:HemY protein